MKQEGIEYDQRMELLEEVTWPKPLDELLAQAFETFASSQPWVRDFELSPKSVVRDMFERSMSFGEYVGVLPARPQRGPRAALPLRRVPGGPPDGARPRRRTRSSSTSSSGSASSCARSTRASSTSGTSSSTRRATCPRTRRAVVPPAPPSVVTNRRAFMVLVRNELFRRVQLAALERDDELAELDPDAGWPDALDRYYAEHDDILTGARRAFAAARHDRRDGCRGRHLARRADDRRPGGRPRLAHPRRGRPRASAEEGAAVVRVTEVVRL